METLQIKSGQGDYTVHFMDTLQQITEQLTALPNLVVLVDRQVATLYDDGLQPLLSAFPTLFIDATEEEKTLTGVTRVLNFLQSSNCTQQSRVVAIGGGITQDIAAFSAHVYYRGIKWVFVPTTLLAMSDSCIGAKCGINLNHLKNQLGVFHSPWRILICLRFLETLTDADIRSGYGEILKLALTGSAKFFAELRQSVIQNGFRNPDMAKLIYKSLCVKKKVIEQDEYETDLRRILNYGHTFGHSLEAITHYAVPHGIGVAWGIDLVNYIALRQGLMSKADFDLIHDFLEQQFSIQIPLAISAADLIHGARRDKKVAGNKVNLILLQRPGDLKIVPTLFDQHLERIITEYLDYKSCSLLGST